MSAANSPGGPAAARWIGTWSAAPQLTEPENLPPAPFTVPGLVLENTTLRQTLRATIGGERLRLRFSNEFGGAPLTITAASVALPVDGAAGVSGIRPGTSVPLRFGGHRSVTLPVGTPVICDPVDLAVEPRTNLTVTVYLAAGQASDRLTSHPGSRTTSYLAPGDQVDSEDLAAAVPVEHWYLLSGAEVLTAPDAAAVVMLGDSLTDGRGSTTDGNDRWPDRLLARLHADPATARVAVLNQAAGGNRLLDHGVGPSGLSRVDRDVLAPSGVRWLVLFEGVNDLGTAAPTPAAAERVADDLVAAYRQVAVRAHAHGIAVLGATLTPFGGHLDYDDPAGTREAARQRINGWIRSESCFDAVLDFDRAVRDPAEPRRLVAAADGGDHLHLTPTGYRMLGDAVPLDLFR